MNKGKRLYPTVAEGREREHLKRKLGLVSTTIAKGGGMPQRTSKDKVPQKKQPLARLML